MPLLYTCIIIMKPEKSEPILKNVFSFSGPKTKCWFAPVAVLRVFVSQTKLALNTRLLSK